MPENYLSGKCPNLKSKTVNFLCKLHKGDKISISCDGLVEHNTIAVPECKTGHIPKNGIELKSITCTDGKWDYEMPECVAGMTFRFLSSQKKSYM